MRGLPASACMLVCALLMACGGTLEGPLFESRPDPPSPPPDVTAPGQPSKPWVWFVEGVGAKLTWRGDMADTEQFTVYRDGEEVGSCAAPPMTDEGVTPGAACSYYVVAIDAAGNRSASSPASILDFHWSTEPIDIGAEHVDGMALTVDRWGRPHIGFNTWGPDVLYTTRVDGSWQVQTVATRETAAQLPDLAIAVDSLDMVHLVVPDAETDQLMHATSMGGTWTWDPIEVCQVLLNDCDAVMDSQDRLHVVYFADGTVIHGTLQDGSWAREELVDPTLDHAAHVSLDVGPNGFMHVGLALGGPGFSYAIRRSGVWSYECVWGCDAARGSMWTRLRVSGAGQAHYATALYPGGPTLHSGQFGAWSEASIPGECLPKSLDCDAAGNVHVCTGQDGVLLHSSLTSTGWTHDALDVVYELPVDSGVDLAVDGSGFVHIVFAYSGRFMYATNRR